MISSLTPVTTAVPLIGVLSLTAVKDAYDDIVSTLNDSDSEPGCRQIVSGVPPVFNFIDL